MKFNTINDAQVELTNSGWFEAINLDMEGEIVELMYRNDCDVETALNQLGAWGTL